MTFERSLNVAKEPQNWLLHHVRLVSPKCTIMRDKLRVFGHGAVFPQKGNPAPGSFREAVKHNPLIGAHFRARGLLTGAHSGLPPINPHV
jgi:hypothetical protein